MIDGPDGRSGETSGLPAGNRGPMTDRATTSFTLPSRYYTDPAILRDEETRVFQRAWIYVGHVSDLTGPGSYLTDEICGQPIVVLRDKDGGLRAMYNVCQHRGHILLRGRGQIGGKIVCPYHAWNYGLDGALVAAPMTQDMEDFDRSRFGLPAVPVAVSAGLIFVNLDPGCRPFAEEMPGFEQTILGHLPGMADFVATDRMEFDIAANWKLVYENFAEGYHIPVAHPALSQLHGRRTKASVVEEKFQFYEGVGRDTFEGFAVQKDEPYLSWQLWPNHCMLSLPGSQHFIILRMLPVAPGSCHERADIYAPPGEEPPNLTVVKRLFAEMFNREDVAIVESVQRGLASRGFDQGRYVADKADGWYSESALHKFHMLLLRELGRA